MLINDEIESQAKEYGFCGCIEGPLSMEKVQTKILDFIKKDKEEAK